MLLIFVLCKKLRLFILKYLLYLKLLMFWFHIFILVKYALVSHFIISLVDFKCSFFPISFSHSRLLCFIEQTSTIWRKTINLGKLLIPPPLSQLRNSNCSFVQVNLPNVYVWLYFQCFNDFQKLFVSFSWLDVSNEKLSTQRRSSPRLKIKMLNLAWMALRNYLLPSVETKSSWNWNSSSI